MIVRKRCQSCGKLSDVRSEIPIDNAKIITLSCNHAYLEEVIPQFTFKNAPEYCEEHRRVCQKEFESFSGKHLFPYQAVGIEHIIKSNAKDLIADEMGLGKTIQALGALKADKKLLPAIVVCKSIAKGNWMWEVLDWLSIPPQVINKSSDLPFKQFPIHILSYDMLTRLAKKFELLDLQRKSKCMECGKISDKGESGICGKESTFLCDKCGLPHLHLVKCNGEMKLQKLEPTGNNPEVQAAWFKILERCQTWIIDETHLIKNPEAKRSIVIKKLSAKSKHIIGLSGTPIKNSATEFFTIFNILKPEKFFRYTNFCNNHVKFEYVNTAVGWSQKFTGLRDPEGFKEMTKDYMLRRTTDEVLPELPKLFKTQQYVEVDDEMQEIYDKSESDFAKWFDTASTQEIQSNLLAQLAKLRHQTSIMKIDYTIDLVMSFLGASDRKLSIFTHHIDARNLLAERMQPALEQLGFPPASILTKGSGVEAEIEEFKNGDARVILLSTLAHGESINLQFCADSILHERQWNPSNEDQAISGRFRRIGQEAKKIRCNIPVALGTIDEYFVELIERKRKLTNEALSGESIEESWSQSGFMGELAEMIATKGRKKWKLD
jgi:SNF2 family DNA or RNA helicase